jgi:type I restriction enzyme, S subunit
MPTWEPKALGDVLHLEYGKPLDRADRGPDALYPVYGANGEKARSDKFYCDRPSIIVGRKGSAGEVNLTEEKFWPLDVTYFVTFDDRHYDLRFLYHLLRTLNLQGLAKGVKPGLNRNDVYNQVARFPPLSEQQRVVGILDKALAGVATARANTEQNLQSARALFDSHLSTVFSRREGWEEKPMGEVCEVKDGTHDSPKYIDDGIPFITQKNIREDGISFENTRYIRQEDHDRFYRRSNAAFGDILISMIGATRGMACLVDDERTFSIKNVGLVKKNPAMNPYFLLYFLKSPQAAHFVRSASRGGAQEFVGLKELRRFPVPIPSLERQSEVSEQCQALSRETQHLACICKRKLAALDALSSCVLFRAFGGEL